MTFKFQLVRQLNKLQELNTNLQATVSELEDDLKKANSKADKSHKELLAVMEKVYYGTAKNIWDFKWYALHCILVRGSLKVPFIIMSTTYSFVLNHEGPAMLFEW